MPRLLLLAALVLAVPAAAAEPPPALVEATEEASALCRDLGGTPEILPDYELVRDLNGDGRDDFVTDLANLQCAGAWSAFCGSGGCPVAAWLSEPGGFVRFDFGYLQGLEIRDGDDLPAVVAHYHGTRCGDDRIGAEGCTRTWRFATNAPDEPPIDAGPPEPAPAPPAPAGWTLRHVPGASPVALGMGTGNIATLAAFCLEGRPFLAVTFHDRPKADPVGLTFAFSQGTVEAEAGFEETAGGAYVVALADGPLADRLGGRDREVDVSAAGRDEGRLSLKGSTRALRGALADCTP
jgi:hypothetical protein